MNHIKQRYHALVAVKCLETYDLICSALDSMNAMRVDSISAIVEHTFVFTPDIILVDNSILADNDYNTLSYIKGTQKLSRIPIIITSSEISSRRKLLKLPLVGFAPNPLCFKSLNKMVGRYLSSSNTRALPTQSDYIDTLTSLNNKDVLKIELGKLIKQSETFDDPFSLLLIDIDDFMAFNYTYGYREGDQVIRKVARCTQLSMIGMAGDIYRYSGAQLVALLTESGIEEAELCGDEILNKVERLDIRNTNSSYRKITISVGIVTLSCYKTISEYTLLECANKCLEEAKYLGKNCFYSRFLSPFNKPD
ncbi:GGDEF domain-containing protein [Pseudoalteromonas luteoviolacea]|uniref:GGDEF domain-containing protein n=1 Tax=Pseudoalteromonas luteoviolacea TaxID=43657 RepID=UPI001B39280E|nr:GGDEF domain-containing protein [Pseudoalteromonas luteoviolacea]MBQ4838502.1 GGDEF domain-containing protein [Pseudoalteromonas luteoviolacea]